MLDPRDRISRLNSKRSIFQMPASGVNRGLFWVCRTACRTRTHHPSIIRWINYRPPAHTATHPSTTTPLNRHVQPARIYHVWECSVSHPSLCAFPCVHVCVYVYTRANICITSDRFYIRALMCMCVGGCECIQGVSQIRDSLINLLRYNLLFFHFNIIIRDHVFIKQDLLY